MTINYSTISNGCRSNRLPFGVPLEDIFPRNDIHPYLREIFVRAFKEISSNGYSVDVVIRKLQGNIAERLVLKEIAVRCKPMPDVFPPGAFLWVLRHFIGLLPVPLLPDYTDQQHFSWRRLSQFCKKSFLKYAVVEVNNRLLTQKLAEELLKLPHANLLLVSVLLNFIRLLSFRPYNRQRLNRITTSCLVRYFSSALFLRPYTPGRNSKIDRLYIPLLLYLVFKWPDIEKYLKSDVNSTIDLKDTPRELLGSRGCIHSWPWTIGIKDGCSQTEAYESCNGLETILDDSTEDVDYRGKDAFREKTSLTFSSPKTKRRKCFAPIDAYESDGLGTISEVSVEEVDFLRDTGTQTESLWRYRSCCCSYGSNYESVLNQSTGDKFTQTNFIERNSCMDKNHDYELSPREDYSLDKSCQTNLIKLRSVKIRKDVSTDVEKVVCICQTIAKEFTEKLLKNDVGTNTDNLPYYGWINPIVSPKNALCSSKTFVSDNEYICDDYGGSTLTLLGNIEETQSKDADEDLLTKISKIGWTYTPPRSTNTNSPLVSPVTMSKTGLKEQNCSLYYNSKEHFNKEEKENCSSDGSDKSKGSVTNISARSKKSFSIASVKNKLNFFKLFDGKRKKLKNSCSFDEISSVKYKKMDSVKSTWF